MQAPIWIDWDADEILQCLLDLPTLPASPPNETVPTHTEAPMPSASPRTNGRLVDAIHRLEKDVEVLHYMLLQQSEELGLLRSKMARMDDKVNKSIFGKDGERERKRGKKLTAEENILFQRPTEIKPGRSQEFAQRDLPKGQGCQPKLQRPHH